MAKTVTIFGSSRPKPGEEEYEIAFYLGKKLAESGLNVCTGGFQGIMDAVSKGASSTNVEIIGVTINLYNATPSKYLTKEIKTNSLFERLKNLVNIGDAYIALQGGTGTMLELALVWEYMNKNMIKPKPFASHSKMWKEIIKIMEKQIALEQRQTGLIKPFEDINECADYIIKCLI
ncbi:LOG family protein [Melioribacteraceae bacterium 4301-Me]|uniref:LOG family protein n=1 Tax=Pyranulibacter aquaticus TaxID=3163344 RepID=UPI00359AC483